MDRHPHEVQIERESLAARWRRGRANCEVAPELEPSFAGDLHAVMLPNGQAVQSSVPGKGFPEGNLVTQVVETRAAIG